MPRGPRIRSESGVYHIVMRGINRQTIFEDKEDCEKFIETLQRYKDHCGYELYAYCLMGNHVHLLLKEGSEPLAQVMRRICGSYVYWYNRKYDRVGNLFQDRYKSEPVEDDKYFLVVLRYIFQNPVKAGMVVSVEEYEWSNYKEYLIKNRMTDVNFAFNIFNQNRALARKGFIEFINKQNEDTCMDIMEKKRITDKDARIIIASQCKIDNAMDLQKLDIPTRDLHLKELKEKHNLSIRQLERLTGINRGIISKL
jgi:putative transposase